MKKKILLLSHYTQAAGPAQKLDAYLRANIDYEVTTIYHPLFPQSKSKSLFFSKQRKYQSRIFFAQFFFEGFYNVFFLRSKLHQINFDLVIAFDPLSFFHFSCWRFLTGAKKTVYFNVDFSQKRFKNFIMNFLFQKLNLFAYKNCDYFFAITYQFIKFLDPKNKLKPKNRIFKLKHTVNLQKIRLITFEKKIPRSLVFVGSLYYSLEFEILFQALNQLKKNKVEFVFHLYGVGNTKNLESLIAKHKLQREVYLRGSVEYNILINKVLPHYQIGVCPYNISPNQQIVKFVHQADDLTTKMVDYISCGLPFITTDISPYLKIIEEEKFGFRVKTKEDWVKYLKQLLTDKELYRQYARNAQFFAKNYDENLVLKPIFKTILS